MLRNQKDGHYESEEFRGTLEECKNYLLEIKEELKNESCVDIEYEEDFLISGYGGYGQFSYEIEEVEVSIKDAIKKIGSQKGSQIFLTTTQLNQVLESKMVSIGRFGVFVTLENGE